MKRTLLLCLLLCSGYLFAQSPGTSCGQKQATENLFRQNPLLRSVHEQIDERLYQYTRAKDLKTGEVGTPTAVVHLPVVVHIIHNNGPENISDIQVQAAIQHLNEAFANTGYYDPADGVSTQIQFCLAKRDPNGNATTGINRIASPLTVMNGWQDYSVDMAMKNLSRWNPNCYINIWVVKDITGGVAGYAYLPSAHGSNVDGIVLEANLFGSSYSNDVLVIHEMGHYLGLYHTFDGGCKNNDCSKDGDRVCDTPPDQSTIGVACNGAVNSCTTDAQSGFSTDVNDLHKDYLDYGNWNCMKVFTQGQSDRMNWVVQNVRQSLLNCRSCADACPSPVTANFTSSANNTIIGTLVSFTNSSTNASGYRWYVNNVLQSTATNYSHTFNTAGTFTVRMVALPGSVLCDSMERTDTILVTCPVTAGFTPLYTATTVNTTVNFSNASTGASSYTWYVNGTLQGTGFNFGYTFTVPGSYVVKLVASGACIDSIGGTAVVTDASGDACVKSSYQKIIGSNTNDEAYDVKRTADGGLMVVGKTGPVNASDALIMKLDAGGNVKWTKTYGGTGEDVFYRILPASDGNYIAVGWGKFHPSHVADIFIVKIDPDGNLLWTKVYASGSQFGDLVRDAVQTPDGGFILSVDYNAIPSVVQALYMRLDANGNLIWSRFLNMIPASEAYGAAPVGDGVIVGGVVARQAGATFNDGYIAKLRMTDGVLLWTRKIESQNRSNRLEHLRIKNNEVSIHMFNSTSWLTDQITPLVLKIDTSGNILYSKSYEIAGLNRTSMRPSMQPTSDGGFLTNVSELQNNTSPRLIKIAQDGTVNWVRNYTSYRSQQLFSCMEDSAGYVTVGKAMKQAGGNEDILIIKTTQQGLLQGPGANCSVTSSTAANNNIPVQSTPADTDFWSGSPAANLPLIQASITVKNVTLNVETPCIDNTPCAPPPPPDTCIEKSFVKRYKNADSTTFINDIDEFPNRNIFLTNQVFRSGKTTFGLTRINQSGGVAWSKEYDFEEGSNHVRSIRLSDNSLLTLTNTTNTTNSGFILTKLNTSGGVIWTRKYKPAQGVFTTGLVQANDGSIFVVGNQRGLSFDEKMVLFKLDAAGNMMWVKKYRFSTALSVNTAYTIFVENDHVYVYGQGWAEHLGSYLCKVSTGNGAVVWLKHYAATGRSTYGKEAIKWGRHFYILNRSNANTTEMELLKLDSNGVLVKATQFNFFTTPSDIVLAPSKADDGIIVYGNLSTPSNPVARNTLIHLDSSLGFVRSHRYNLASLSDPVLGITPLQGNSLLGWGWIFHGGKYEFHLTRFLGDGILPGCTPDTISPVFSAPATDVRSYSFNVTDETFQEFPIQLNVLNNPLIVTDLGCDAPVMCDSFKISGNDSVCNTGTVVDFRGLKNADCHYNVNWLIDTSFAEVIAASDTLVRIRFKRNGSVTLHGQVLASCSTLKDSLTVTVLDKRHSLNLGPDKQLCKISTLTLNAGSGFRTYRWQDGSSDSTYTVFQPGTYFVEAADHCGNVFRDTVIVSLAPDVPFDLGTDLTKCNNDTLTITAPAGFLKYSWATNYNITNRYSAVVQVWPASDTTYSVMAETAAGCLVYDTIYVKVNTSLPLKLDADTSFCASDSLIINAPGGFATYMWNTGATTQQVIVKNKGLYILEAKADNNCISKDSIEVLNVYPLPAVNIGKDTLLCMNGNYVFDAGNFVTYLWQDGTAGRTFTASQVGQYWVKVRDANSCVNSDTAYILRMADLPQNFLDTAVEFCPSENITLTAKGTYSRYKWSTGSISRSLTVNVTGRYWLEVTNADGCTNREYIDVRQKFCKNSIDFPNAFSPNNDRRNDTYKPIVKGILLKYRLIIYNRWGQRLFETTQPTMAWDGTLAGTPQDTGAFVWYCEYQFAGEEVKQAKGMVTLVR